VRRAGLSTIIMADGFSCREQISQQTNRHALHLAEVMQIAHRGAGSANEMYPEGKLVARRRAGLRRARGKALAALGAIAAGAVLLWKMTKHH